VKRFYHRDLSNRENSRYTSCHWLAKSKGATNFGVCNVVGSFIPRATSTHGSYTHAGPEIGVSFYHRNFTAQDLCGLRWWPWSGIQRGTLPETDTFNFNIEAWSQYLGRLKKPLQSNEAIKILASQTRMFRNALYLGEVIIFPVALEGACWSWKRFRIPAEGYPAAENEHGPIALIDGRMPVVFICD